MYSHCRPVGRRIGGPLRDRLIIGRTGTGVPVPKEQGFVHGRVTAELGGGCENRLPADVLYCGNSAFVATMATVCAGVSPPLGKRVGSHLRHKAGFPGTSELGGCGRYEPHVPLCHKNASWSLPHFDTMIIAVADAARQKTVCSMPRSTRGGGFEPDVVLSASHGAARNAPGLPLQLEEIMRDGR